MGLYFPTVPSSHFFVKNTKKYPCPFFLANAWAKNCTTINAGNLYSDQFL